MFKLLQTQNGMCFSNIYKSVFNIYKLMSCIANFKKTIFHRFCGIFNSFVKRNVDGTSSDVSSIHHRSRVGLGPTTNLAHQSITVPQSMQNKGQQSSSKAGLVSPSTEKDVKSESNGSGVHAQASKPYAAKKIPPMPVKEKKVQKDKGSSSIGGSLTNLWGRASAKSKPSCPAENSNLIPNPTGWFHLLLSYGAKFTVFCVNLIVSCL